MSRIADWKTVVLVAAVGLGLGACSQSPYGDRSDGITGHFGDAVNTNKVAQTIDPWPPYAGDTSLRGDGRRAKTAADRYYSGTILPPVPAATSGIAPVSAAALAPPPPVAQ